MFKGFNVSSILDKVSKSLSVVDKALPLYEEAKPIVDNVKSLFFKKKNTSSNIKEQPITRNKEVKNNLNNSNNPIFFQ